MFNIESIVNAAYLSDENYMLLDVPSFLGIKYAFDKYIGCEVRVEYQIPRDFGHLLCPLVLWLFIWIRRLCFCRFNITKTCDSFFTVARNG